MEAEEIMAVVAMAEAMKVMGVGTVAAMMMAAGMVQQLQPTTAGTVDTQATAGMHLLATEPRHPWAWCQ